MAPQDRYARAPRVARGVARHDPGVHLVAERLESALLAGLTASPYDAAAFGGHAPAVRMYSSTFFASTSSGTLPPSTTVSLNAFTSYFASERFLRLVALAIDLGVADLVAARLAGPRAIAIDFARDFERIRSVHVDEELHALFARPPLRVNAGVDDEPAGAERDGL